MHKWVQKLSANFEDIDLDKEVETLKEELETAQGQRRTRAIKRLEVLRSVPPL
jgi:hypothetical protein